MYRTWPLALFALAASGCGVNAELERDYGNQISLGETMFQGGKYDLAVEAYIRALKLKPNEYQPYIALGTAASECSVALYGEAEHLLEMRKIDAAMDAVKRADEKSDAANRAFSNAIKMRPNDMIGHYGYALMLFKRSASPFRFPFPQDNPDAIKQRSKERDECIRQFELVLGKEAVATDSADHPKRCASPQAHRYLGLAFVMRGDWERNDIEHMREHLSAYLAWVQGARDMIVHRKAGSTDQERQQRDRELQVMDKELLEVQDLLRTLYKALTDYQALFRVGREEPTVPSSKREGREAMLQREILTLEAMVREFDGLRQPAPR